MKMVLPSLQFRMILLDVCEGQTIEEHIWKQEAAALIQIRDTGGLDQDVATEMVNGDMIPPVLQRLNQLDLYDVWM